MPLTPDTKLGKPKRRGLAPSGGAAAPAAWYADAIVAYQPKGAASLAASYTNLGTNGAANDAAPGVEPTFDTATGWTCNGTKYLTMGGLLPGAAYTVLVQFTDGSTDTDRTVFGCFSGAVGFLVQVHTGGNHDYYNGGTLSKAGGVTSGNVGFAAKTAYRDGSAETGTIGAGTPPALEIYIAGLNFESSFVQGFVGKIQAFGVWSTTLTAPQVAAKAAAMAAV
jgi:hypothetical protein